MLANCYNALFGIWKKLIHSELASSGDSRNRRHCHYSHVTSSVNNYVDQQVLEHRACTNVSMVLCVETGPSLHSDNYYRYLH